MAFEGMDPDAVDALGARINDQANALGSIINHLDGLLASMMSNWSGNDATRFHDTYQGSYRGQLMRAQHALEQLSTAAHRNAHQQREVSA